MATPAELNIPKPFRAPLLNNHDVSSCTIPELQTHLSAAHFTSQDLTHHSLDRIHATNQYLECVIETNPDALSISQDLDKERSQNAGATRGPLHGIPILVKDNIATADELETTAGSWSLLGSRVPRDAHVVKLLREVGAVIIGHANMEEFAGGKASSMSLSYSPRGGQVRNPYDLRKEASGSSGGSAVAVAAGIVTLAFGTETDSSIIWPAMKTGVVGIKPTIGLTSRAGVIPLSKNFDTVGPLARSVRDAAIGLDAIAGVDQRDEATMVEGRRQKSSYAGLVSGAEVLNGARFGLPVRRCWELVEEDEKAIASRVFDVMRTAGAEIVEVDFPSVWERTNVHGTWDWRIGPPSQSEGHVVDVDFYNGLSAYLSELEDTNIRSVEDLFQYNKDNAGTEGAVPGDHPAFPTGQDALAQVIAIKGDEDETYQSALHHVRSQTRGHGIDAALNGFCFSSQPDHRTKPGPERLDALLLCDRKGVGMQYAAQAGYPIITIPIGVDDKGMPVGLSFQQTAWEEGSLITWASAVEDLWRKIDGPRRTPEYKDHRAKNIPVETF